MARHVSSNRPSRRAMCCGAGAALLCCLPALRAGAEALRDLPLALVEIAPGIHVSQGVHAEAVPSNLGAIANVGFIVGNAGVAVIDSGGCLLWGRRLREAIRRTSDLPITHLVQTHMHPDHVFGAAAFLADGPTILGHRNLPAALASRQAYYARRLAEVLGDLAAGSVVVPPTQLVDSEAEIDLGGRILRVTAHRTAHTDNDLSIFDLATRTLWAGDLLFIDRIPALDGSLLGWLATIEELRRLPAARVVPGHGPHAAPWPAAADAQRRYLTLLRDRIRKILRDGGTMEHAIATVGSDERDRWLLFDDYNARNVTAAFHELECA
ncbi:MAG TPA: quinoprotein relay system zinc metallohydrolase 2 [Stellaceae bacterium]